MSSCWAVRRFAAGVSISQQIDSGFVQETLLSSSRLREMLFIQRKASFQAVRGLDIQTGDLVNVWTGDKLILVYCVIF
ncbi:MAG: hypothetical protein EZS28_029975 [Streblomastix strix]|uniref:Uncharacterized protein n=1 Tax=Streblomastix strix TaxID=222440 RepID=A0A5J4UW21_9EUKA|nr:MAG: hypothetical protein EZS28_029975 [Streblomastix strix]